MQKKIVLASNNKGKINELSQMLGHLQLDIIAQKEFTNIEADESAASFIENALIKARHASKHSGLPALADDSGLVVPALNGSPGIYSARYAGEDANDNKNNDKLTNEMKNFGEEQRQAYFYCALVFLRDPQDPCPIISTASWHGQILLQAQGKNGFGYDPLFWLPSQNKTAAEISRLEKSTISHRGMALKNLLPQLEAIFV